MYKFISYSSEIQNIGIIFILHFILFFNAMFHVRVRISVIFSNFNITYESFIKLASSGNNIVVYGYGHY